MPVSPGRRFAFVHIRKTAGTSITRALESLEPNMLYNEKGLWDVLCAHPERRALLATLRQFYPTNSIVGFPQWHLPALILRKLLGAQAWEGLYSFAFVRNPWDLVVSNYAFERRFLAARHVAEVERDRAEALRRSIDFDHFVRLYPLLEVPDMTSMISDESGRTIVSYVGRFENLANDFSTACAAIGIEPVRLPRENVSLERSQYRSYYTRETRELVRRYFARDIERFGYEY